MFVNPRDRVKERSTSNSQTVFTVTGGVDVSYNPFSASMAIGDSTIGGIVERSTAFASGTLTRTNTNEITLSNIIESKGTFSSGGVKEIFMGQPALPVAPTDLLKPISTAALAALNTKITAVWDQIFTANDTFVPVTGLVVADVESTGPGGGGGGAAGSTSQVYSGGGGAGGETAIRHLTAAQIGASQTVTVPAGGNGGSGAVSGSPGAGDTTFGSLVVAKPGQGGHYGSASGFPFGGVGGTGGTGDILIPGENGSSGFFSNTTNIVMPAGSGGSSRYGGGALGGYASGAAVAGVDAGGHGAGGSGATTHNTAGTAAGGKGSGGIIRVRMFCAQDVIPTPQIPVVIQRTDVNDWNINLPIINGAPGEYVQWFIKDIGPSQGIAQLFTIGGVSTNENGIIRVQCDYPIAGSVFEYAKNVGLMTDALATWDRYGGGHASVGYNGSAIIMDGAGPNLRSIPIGSYVGGNSLSIQQTPIIYLPSDFHHLPSPILTNIGGVVQAHTFDATGLLFTATHTITAPGIGEQNSYDAMFAFNGLDTAQFGANASFAVNTHPGSPVQSANQGQNTVARFWDSTYPRLKFEMSLPTGNPGSPDGWTLVTTSDQFVSNNPTFAKAYFNSRSGSTRIAVSTPNSHSTKYRVYKS